MTDPTNQDTPVAWMRELAGTILVELYPEVDEDGIPYLPHIETVETIERLIAAEVADQFDRMRERVARLRNKVLARHLSDADLIDEQSAVDAVIDRGFVEAGGISECWNERFEEVAHEIKRRGLERQLAQHNSKPALTKLQDTSHD